MGYTINSRHIHIGHIIKHIIIKCFITQITFPV